jgi:PTS system ascorbate-specific IIA component
MIGIFVITHGTMGEALLHNVVHVLNKRPPQLVQLGVAAQEDPLDLLPMANELLRRVDTGKGVLILTDMWGATPSNVAVKLLLPGRIEGVTGVSLPMLLRAITYRNRDMETLVTKAVSGGRDGVIHMEPI